MSNFLEYLSIYHKDTATQQHACGPILTNTLAFIVKDTAMSTTLLACGLILTNTSAFTKRDTSTSATNYAHGPILVNTSTCCWGFCHVSKVCGKRQRSRNKHFNLATSSNQLRRKASKFTNKSLKAINSCQNSVRAVKKPTKPKFNGKRPRSPKAGADSFSGPKKARELIKDREKPALISENRKNTLRSKD